MKEHSPKYVFWPTRHYEILEETFQEIRQFGSYVIGWFFDDECRFDDYSRWWVPYMDYILTADKASVSRYESLGAKAFHLLVTCDPDNFVNLKANYSIDVSFVGSRFIADRDNQIKKLIDCGVSVSAYGNGWDNGFVSHDEMVKIFSTSKINLCFTKSYTNQRNQLKGKIFDIVMSGGFLLCEYVDGIEELFEIGKEIICFNNHEEAIDKINYYLINNHEREQVAELGKLRAVQNLAQHRLFEKVFNEIEVDIEKRTNRIILSTPVTKMPKNIRMSHVQFHLRWAIILKHVGLNKKQWKDEYRVIYKYIPFVTMIVYKYKTFVRSLFNKLKSKIRFNKK